MATYTLSFDLGNLLGMVGALETDMMIAVDAGVRRAAERIADQWREAVMSTPGIWMPEREAYYKSIVVVHHPMALKATVLSDLKLADELEQGRPAKDLKQMLGTSPKVRQNKKGQRYLIIPFRHNVPSASGHSSYAKQMPANIHKQAKKLSKSLVIGHGQRLSGTGAMSVKTKKYLTVPTRKYQWGARLPAGLAPKLKPHHATDPYASMVRMDTSSGKQKSSAYMTFRIMSEAQTGKWIVPAKPGLHIARKIAEGADKIIEEEIKAAL